MKINKCEYTEFDIDLRDGHKLPTNVRLYTITSEKSGLVSLFKKPEITGYMISASNDEESCEIEFNNRFVALKYYMSMVDRLNGGHTLKGYYESHPVRTTKR